MFTLDRSLGRRMSRFAMYLLAITAMAVSLSSPAAMSRQTTACLGVIIDTDCYFGKPAASTSLAPGAASWDQNMVRAFFKATMNIDIANGPAAITHQDMLDQLSPEFAR